MGQAGIPYTWYTWCSIRLYENCGSTVLVRLGSNLNVLCHAASCRVVSFVLRQVLRPIVVVAPVTHSFGTIHTQRRGNATLYVGNPTYVDAEWTLSHIPVPPPKHRLFERNQASKAAASSAASAAAVATSRRLTGQHNCEYLDGKGTAGGRGSPPGGSAGVSSSPPCSRETNGRRASGVASQGGSDGLRGGRSRKFAPTASPASAVAAAEAGAPSSVPPFFVDDPSVFVFNEEIGVARGVKLPLSASASCLPEDWNRLEVRTIATAAAVVGFRVGTCWLFVWPVRHVEKTQKSKVLGDLLYVV